MSLTIYAGNGLSSESNIVSEKDNINGRGKDIKHNSGTFFAGNSNLNMDSVEEKRKEARRKAWDVVSSAWDSDKAIDESVQERRDKCEKMRELEAEANNALKRINDEMDALKKEYNIEPDSEEQKELELIFKYRDMMKNPSDVRFSEEETEQYRQIDMDNLSEFQNRMLELYNQKAGPEKNLQDARKEIIKANQEITAIGIERLKTHAMTDAEKSADEIMKAAGEEIMGMIIEDGMENVDEKLKEAEEEAEKKAEEKEEKEEELQEIKEERAIQEALLEGTKEAYDRAEAVIREGDNTSMDIGEMADLAVKSLTQPTGDVEKSLEDIKNSMAVLEADLKGLKVDELV